MRMNLADWRIYQESKMKVGVRKRREKEPATGRKARKYVVSLPFPANESIEVLALTKSEARSRMKKQLGVSRLPVGTVIEQVS